MNMKYDVYLRVQSKNVHNVKDVWNDNIKVHVDCVFLNSLCRIMIIFAQPGPSSMTTNHILKLDLYDKNNLQIN